MKKTTAILLFLLLSVYILQANTKVIENPEYEVKSSGIYNIPKIELTRNSTRIYVHITFVPHWWVQFNADDYIRDPKTGKAYKVIGIEGSKLGEKLWMPDSGDSTIVLIFPKLAKSVEKIDFGNDIFGLSLKETKNSNKNIPAIPDHVTKWIDTRLEKAPSNGPVDYNSPQFFNTDTGYLIGYIKGYDTRLGFSTGIVYTNNPITNEDYPTVVQIFPDGRFEAKLPLHFPASYYAVIKDQIINFYLEPKQTLALLLDWDEFLIADRLRNIRYNFKNITYKGPLAKINNDLRGFIPDPFNYETFQKKIAILSPSDFKNEQNIILQDNLKKADEYKTNSNLSPQASLLIKNELLLNHARILFDFVERRRYMVQQDTANQVLKIPLPSNYYDFLKELPLNDNSLLVSNVFDVFINRFEYCTPLLSIQRKNYTFKPEIDFITYIKQEKIEIAKNDRDLLELNAKPNKTDEENAILLRKKDTLMAIFQIKYKDIYKTYSEKYIMPLLTNSQANRYLADWKQKDSVLVHVLGVQPNFVYDIAKIRSLKYALKGTSRQSAISFWDSLKTSIKHPYAIKTGEQILKEQFPETGITSYELKPGVATEIFKRITAPFKGKILFVDFWATTCGPCIGGIKQMKPLREKYKDNPDFEFIFITDERSSPEEPYKKFVAEQELKNTFRITADGYYYLRQLFKFNGIPRYVVIDKEGKVISDNFEMHNFEYELNKILSKK